MQVAERMAGWPKGASLDYSPTGIETAMQRPKFQPKGFPVRQFWLF
jgi:hypothetical protein